MELVDGGTLRAWLRAAARRCARSSTCSSQAGAGSPPRTPPGSSIATSSPTTCCWATDGRVRVTDFGLASASPSDATGAARRPSRVARRAARAGPDAHRRGHGHAGVHGARAVRRRGADARTDQFAFCVALYEALYGERPFARRDVRRARENVTAGEVLPPPRRRRYRAGSAACCCAGWRPHPAMRFPSMEDLLAALAHRSGAAAQARARVDRRGRTRGEWRRVRAVRPSHRVLW